MQPDPSEFQDLCEGIEPNLTVSSQSVSEDSNERTGSQQTASGMSSNNLKESFLVFSLAMPFFLTHVFVQRSRCCLMDGGKSRSQ